MKARAFVRVKHLRMRASNCKKVTSEKRLATLGEPLEEPKNNLSENDLREVEFYCKRIRAVDPKNQTATYRMALVNAINGNQEEAFREMSLLTDLPQAHAWLAKAVLCSKVAGSKVAGLEVDTKELLLHLEMAKKWEKCDFRLPFYYSRLLEGAG